ncbi:MAG: flavodoxin family protein [Chloroflexia bacterium]|nr:flavodoxin family protein [Chloroflexia bacterium]
MEKILILIGSPRKNGNSVSMAKRLRDKLNPELYEVNFLHLYDYQIDACIDCRVCKKGRWYVKLMMICSSSTPKLTPVMF